MVVVVVVMVVVVVLVVVVLAVVAAVAVVVAASRSMRQNVKSGLILDHLNPTSCASFSDAAWGKNNLTHDGCCATFGVCKLDYFVHIF